MKTSLLACYLLCVSSLYSTASYVSIRHHEGKQAGCNIGYSTVDYAHFQDHTHLQTIYNLRAHLFNNGQSAGNLGAGFRHALHNTHSEISAYAFYDFRYYSAFFAQQLSAGTEWLSQAFDVRFNGYLPFGRNKKFQERFFESFDHNEIKATQKLSTALPSIDAEIGRFILPRLYLATGPYYLFQEKQDPIYSGYGVGWKIKCDVDISSYCKIGSTISYDPIFKTRMDGYFSFHITLGKTKKEPSSVQPKFIRRQEIIPIYTGSLTHITLNKQTTPSLNILFVNNQSKEQGLGTFEAPFRSLKEAELHSQEGDIIYIYPGDGTAKGMDEGIILKDKQILASSAANLELNSIVIPAQTPDQKPILTNIHPSEPIVTNLGNNELDGFCFIDFFDYINDDSHYDTEDMEEASDASSIWDDPEIQEWIDFSNE